MSIGAAPLPSGSETVAISHALGAAPTSLRTAEDIRDLFVRGLYAAREQASQERAITRGTADKQNPFITDVGVQCDRKIWFSLANKEEESLDLPAIVTFEVGSAVEDRVAAALRAAGEHHVRELRTTLPIPDTQASGRVDFLLADDEIIELKSIGPQQLSFMLDRLEKGRPEHRKQLNLYLHASNMGRLIVEEDGSERVVEPKDRGFLVYVNKSPDWKDKHYDHPIVVFEVRYDAAMARRDLDRLAMISALPVDPGVPARMKADRFPCGSRRKDGSIKRWCPYWKHCWEGQP